MQLGGYLRDNQANWDDRVPIHLESAMYDVERFVRDPAALSTIVAFDAPLIGDVTGLSIAHLQCHIGTDTISLSRLGAAEVIGVDFSANAIAAARDLATRSGDQCEFVHANVYDAAAAVGRTVDFVYTSVGTITWLGELDRWAAAIGGLLEPGGRFYIRDGHPAMWVFGETDDGIVPRYDYRTTPDTPLTWDEAGTYTDGDHSTITHTRFHDWNHSLPDIVNALVGAGLTVDRMAEHDGCDWAPFPSCVKEGDQWFLPAPLRGRVPAMYSIWATKR